MDQTSWLPMEVGSARSRAASDTGGPPLRVSGWWRLRRPKALAPENRLTRPGVPSLTFNRWKQRAARPQTGAPPSNRRRTGMSASTNVIAPIPKPRLMLLATAVPPRSSLRATKRPATSANTAATSNVAKPASPPTGSHGDAVWPMTTAAAARIIATMKSTCRNTRPPATRT